MQPLTRRTGSATGAWPRSFGETHTSSNWPRETWRRGPSAGAKRILPGKNGSNCCGCSRLCNSPNLSKVGRQKPNGFGNLPRFWDCSTKRSHTRARSRVQRAQFEELVVRAASVASRQEIIIFGSQSVHAVTDHPPAEVLVSAECDVWLRDEPLVAERLLAELGKDSDFARASGVYVDPLPPDLPMAPAGWEHRLVACRIGKVTARCLEIHDLIVTKLAPAGSRTTNSLPPC